MILMGSRLAMTAVLSGECISELACRGGGTGGRYESPLTVCLTFSSQDKTGTCLYIYFHFFCYFLQAGWFYFTFFMYKTLQTNKYVQIFQIT